MGTLDSNVENSKDDRTRNAIRATIIYLAMALAAFSGELYLALQSGAWEMFAVASVGFSLVIVAWISIYFIRRDRANLGITLLIGASLLSVLTAPFFIVGLGLMLGLGTVLVVLTIASQTLPFQDANRLLLISVVVAIVAGAADLTVDLFDLNQRLDEPTLQVLLAALGSLMILAYGILIVRQFKSYPLLTKLLVAFLFVALVPLALLAGLNDYNTQEALTDNANKALFAAASQTADSLDTFIDVNLDNVGTEAQLPVFLEYLNLPAEQRADSATEAEVKAILEALRRRDKLFITSYALLDAQGRNVIDTNPFDINQDEAERDYFQKPMATGLAYVSPVQFLSTVDDSYLYISSPIRSDTKTETVGVLRVSYDAAILQQLIVGKNELVGQGSFAILLDENHVHLAHGRRPDFIPKAIVPLETARAIELIESGRLPDLPLEKLALNLPDFEAGLQTSGSDEPYFTTSLAVTESQNSAAFVNMKRRPWTVVFVQPQEVFLAPIREQTRTILFFAIAIAALVVIVAFWMAQLLATPLLHLTEAVSQFTQGNLEARTPVDAEDEIGVLGRNFNSMAKQVGNLLKRLEEHARELELEVGERKRAETALRQYQEQLEEQVAIRTNELTTTNEQLQMEIVEHKHTQAALEKAKEIAESANQAKSAFLATITHELRTPLNAIIGYSEMLQEDAADVGYTTLIPDLKKIWTAGDHLLTIIKDLLDLSKIEAGKMTLYPEEFDVPTLLENVITNVQPMIQKNKNEFHIHFADDVGLMHADPMKVRQILLNLLSNAAKFTESGEIKLRVDHYPGTDENNGAQVVFKVMDTGIGMNQEQMDHVFEPFTQADASTTRKYGGTGLGLAISYRFCKIMGGDISVESELGKGSVFTFSLPVRVANPAMQLEI